MVLKGKNNIDLTCYVALGDSVTAGYTDGALCYYGQQHSFAKLLACQFELAGGGIFRQPLIDPDSVGIGFSGNSCLTLKPHSIVSKPGEVVLSYLAPQGDVKAFLQNNYSTLGPFNNMGVPAAKVIALLKQGLGNANNGVGNYNPFFTRMASDLETASVLSDALAMDPTFFSLFIGSNDALTFAISGATSDAITPSLGAAGIGFEESFRAIINALTANGAKGVVANIPDIISLPFFTAIPYNGLMLDTETAQALNTKYSHTGILFQQEKNPFIFFDPASDPPDIRQLRNGEMILLDVLLDPEKEFFMRGSAPIPKKYILTKPEIEKVQAAIREFNEVIRSVASDKGLAIVDLNGMLKRVKVKSTYNPKTLGLGYKKRSVFSLDGLHPNALGQALLANEFIKAINSTYKAGIPPLKIIKFKQKTLPL
jgi:lysophospholipase L1-like esterase